MACMAGFPSAATSGRAAAASLGLHCYSASVLVVPALLSLDPFRFVSCGFWGVSPLGVCPPPLPFSASRRWGLLSCTSCHTLLLLPIRVMPSAAPASFFALLVHHPCRPCRCLRRFRPPLSGSRNHWGAPPPPLLAGPAFHCDVGGRRTADHRASAPHFLTKYHPPLREGKGQHAADAWCLTSVCHPPMPPQLTFPLLSQLIGSLGPSLGSLDLPP